MDQTRPKRIKLENVEVTPERISELLTIRTPDLNPDPSTEFGNDTGDSTRPDCWSEKQLAYFKSANKWLRVKNGKLGCDICIQVSELDKVKRMGVSVSPEWKTFSITYYGVSLVKQQLSLRKKIFEHRKSIAHILCEKILDQYIQALMPSGYATAKTGSSTSEYQWVPNIKQEMEEPIQFEELEELNQEYIKEESDLEPNNEELTQLFRTVYNIVKLNRGFEDLVQDVKLQNLNGASSINELHCSEDLCQNICNHIAGQMRNKLIQKILDSDTKISIILDVPKIGRSVLMIYLRVLLDNKEMDVFLDLVELPKLSELISSLFLRLNFYRLDEAVLQRRLLSICVDGGLNLANDLHMRFPNVVIWQSVPHRFHQEFWRIVKDFLGENPVEGFVGKIQSGLIQEPKCLRPEWAVELSNILENNKHSCIKLLLRQFKAIYQWFSASTRKESSKIIQDILKCCVSEKFLRNLLVINDALEEIDELVSKLSKTDIPLVKAHRLICRQIDVFEGISKTPDPPSYTLQEHFSGIQLQDNPLHNEINKKLFFETLSHALKVRLLSTKSLSPTLDQEVLVLDGDYRNFIAEAKMLDPEFWPDEIPQDFGEPEIGSLSNRFGLDPRVVLSFREFRRTGGRIVDEKMKNLLGLLRMVPVCAPEVERGNRFLGKGVMRRSLEELSNVLFVRLNGPPLEMFDADSYSRSWRFDNGLEYFERVNEVGGGEPPKDGLWEIF